MSAAPLAVSTRARSRELIVPGLTATAVAVGVFLLARAYGGYGVSGWAPAGIVLALGVAALAALGRRPSRSSLLASLGFLALGGWSLLSVTWGGIPEPAWHALDQALIAALAVALGSALATVSRAAVAAGVLGGIVPAAAELAFRPALGSWPDSWFTERTLEGTVGYHNAQAGLCAIGIGLATWALAGERRPLRAFGGASIGILAAVLLLTQSRGGMGAAVAACVVALLWTRDANLLLRLLPAVAGVAFLALAVRRVDRALVSDGDLDGALRAYAAATALVALCLALTSLVAVRSARARRALLLGAVLAALVLAAVGSVAAISSGRLESTLTTFRDHDPNVAGAGETRLLSISPNGRDDAWRVAWALASDHPVVGAGQGTYTRAWIADRRLTDLFLLQPHSIELELLAELGLVGLCLFVLAIAATAACAVRGERRLGGAALAMLTALVLQASVDWTWSFPALVVPVALVAGAAAGGALRRPPGAAVTVVGAAGLLAVLVALAAPWLSERALDRATELQHRDAPAAFDAIARARDWNPWSPAPLELRGLLLERSGAFGRAADAYHEAATLSRSSWIDHFREARVARALGDARRHAEACRAAHAANPAEKRLYDGVCAAG
jgi:hypothetical protein